MKTCLSILLISSCLVSLPAAVITYTGGVTNNSSATGPSWVGGSKMFINIIANYGGSPLGASGATAATQSGFNLFEPLGGGMDITKLRWEVTSLTLYQGAGSVTQSPGPASAGFEDYRYNDNGGLAAANLIFYYDNDEWASGYITRFITEVAHNMDANATATGEAYLNMATLAGQDFFTEVMGLTGGTGAISFTADNFNAVAPTDPGTFTSDGTLTFVPEPSQYAMIFGAVVLFWSWRRRKS